MPCSIQQDILILNSDKPALQENLQSSWQAMDTNLSICEEINKHTLNRTGDNMDLSLVTDVAQNKKIAACEVNGMNYKERLFKA